MKKDVGMITSDLINLLSSKKIGDCKVGTGQFISDFLRNKGRPSFWSDFFLCTTEGRSQTPPGGLNERFPVHSDSHRQVKTKK